MLEMVVVVMNALTLHLEYKETNKNSDVDSYGGFWYRGNQRHTKDMNKVFCNFYLNSLYQMWYEYIKWMQKYLIQLQSARLQGIKVNTYNP